MAARTAPPPMSIDPARYPRLSRIDTPADLRRFDESELPAIAEEYHRAQQRIATAAKAMPQPVADVRAQAGRLVFKGFLTATPWERLHDLPRYLNRNGPTELEGETALNALAPALEALGHEVRTPRLASGLQGICRVAERFEGGADRRREGVARGY